MCLCVHHQHYGNFNICVIDFVADGIFLQKSMYDQRGPSLFSGNPRSGEGGVQWKLSGSGVGREVARTATRARITSTYLEQRNMVKQ